METALYFPYMRVPESPWFTQVLLYWDRAASIVPSSLRYSDDPAHSYMQELQREGLLEYLSPDDEMWELGHDAFYDGFMGLLSAQTDPHHADSFVRIHSGKMSYQLFDELQKRGLAREEGGGSSWWQIEGSTADTYMAYLAAAMSGARPDLLPVTDRTQSMETFASGGDDTNRRLAELRYSVIRDALPAPGGPISVADIRAFKEKNWEELNRCRVYIDARLADLSQLPDPMLRDVKAKGIMQEIEREVAVLREQMEKRRWPKIALVGFGGVMGVALTTAATAATGGAALAVGLSLGAGVLQAGAAAFQVADSLKQRPYDPRAPLAYAALAGRL